MTGGVEGGAYYLLLLLTTDYLLPTAYCLLLAAHCALRTFSSSASSAFITYYSLLTAHLLLLSLDALRRLVHLEHALGCSDVGAVSMTLLLPVGARAARVLGDGTCSG